ncbi:hypothetical protein PGTUg99_000005, partial [Puccinia graminis f. sp. tritici]
HSTSTDHFPPPFVWGLPNIPQESWGGRDARPRASRTRFIEGFGQEVVKEKQIGRVLELNLNAAIFIDDDGPVPLSLACRSRTLADQNRASTLVDRSCPDCIASGRNWLESYIFIQLERCCCLSFTVYCQGYGQNDLCTLSKPINELEQKAYGSPVWHLPSFLIQLGTRARRPLSSHHKEINLTTFTFYDEGQSDLSNPFVESFQTAPLYLDLLSFILRPVMYQTQKTLDT